MNIDREGLISDHLHSISVKSLLWVLVYAPVQSGYKRHHWTFRVSMMITAAIKISASSSLAFSVKSFDTPMGWQPDLLYRSASTCTFAFSIATEGVVSYARPYEQASHPPFSPNAEKGAHRLINRHHEQLAGRTHASSREDLEYCYYCFCCFRAFCSSFSCRDATLVTRMT